MMRSGVRRVRLLVALSFAILVIWVWNRNSQRMLDVYRVYGAELAVGGGSVLRPDLQRPEMHEFPEDSSRYPTPDLSVPETSDLDQGVDDHHIDPEDAPEKPSMDDLLHSDAAMVVEASASPTTSAEVAPTPAPKVDDLDADDDTDTDTDTATEEQMNYDDGSGYGRVEAGIVDGTLELPPAIHWQKQPPKYPLTTTVKLPAGTPKPIPRIQRAINKLSMYGADEDKLQTIKAAIAHSWKGYKMFGWPWDEVRPISQEVGNPFNGWGATLVDSLDTLYISGHIADFEEAVEAVGNIDFTTSGRADIPVFETVIRYLGGLLGAYDVSGQKHKVLLDKAVQLAEVLYTAFDTPNHIPMTYYRWKPESAGLRYRAATRVVLAELGTLSLEFTRLAQLTGEAKYYDAVARITDEFETWQNNTRLPGMWPTTFDASGCGDPPQHPTTIRNQLPVPAQDTPKAASADDDEETIDDDSLQHQGHPGALDDDGLGVHEAQDHYFDEDSHGNTWKQKRQFDSDSCTPQGFASSSKNGAETYTLSGASDSMYEYLPKEFILLGGQVDKYREMYLTSIDVAIKKLVYKPMTQDERDVLLTGDLKLSPDYSSLSDDVPFIERFSPEAAHLACFTGGMFAMAGVVFDKPEHVDIASKLTDGCVWLYNVTETGIMPESATIMQCEDTWGECPWDEKAYWRVLDPRWDSREDAVAPRKPEVTPPKPEPITHTPPPREEVRDDSNENLFKRQLAVPADIESSSTSSSSSSSSAGVASSTSSDPEAPTPAEHPASTTNSHENFVQNRIKDERLPPGFVSFGQRKYILRPEAIESVFYMYRITGDPHWREVGWDMFTAINKHTRVNFGYSAIDDVTKPSPVMSDQMESFWLAETLKYFYLLFDDPAKWSLDEWVLNTEAHLLKRPKAELL